MLIQLKGIADLNSKVFIFMQAVTQDWSVQRTSNDDNASGCPLRRSEEFSGVCVSSHDRSQYGYCVESKRVVTADNATESAKLMAGAWGLLWQK